VPCSRMMPLHTCHSTAVYFSYKKHVLQQSTPATMLQLTPATELREVSSPTQCSLDSEVQLEPLPTTYNVQRQLVSAPASAPSERVSPIATTISPTPHARSEG
jgi:hypothetical protein